MAGPQLRGLEPGQDSSEETSRLRHCVRFDQPGIQTPDLPHPYRSLNNSDGSDGRVV